MIESLAHVLDGIQLLSSDIDTDETKKKSSVLERDFRHINGSGNNKFAR